MSDLETIRSAIEAARKYLDCGDNSCWFALRKGGMRTNGGCRCLERPFAAASLAAMWKAAVAVAERMTWHTIATAPKDGTEVLLLDPEWGRMVGTYDALFSMWVAPGCCLTPTHWMPIPEVQERESEDK